eukprot:TRINITY_DN44_c0_g1_i13.p1 TRINITY_DN44_c0_g1~~TRINITY_DN44_c0_g1_i13.p1  ORF type:complete len:570 (+),score=132.55 TRINITY_DN44_c0_g1_i13:49-1710(+)
MNTKTAGLLLSMAATVMGDAVIEVGQTMKPFPNQKCAEVPFTGDCTCNTVIRGAAVHIEEGFHSGDVLSCPGCASLGITADFSGDKLQLSGGHTIDDYATALSSVVFTPAGAGSRLMVLNYGHGLFSRKNHHFYNYFGGKLSWQDAQIACSAKDNDILGLPGYLMTITSQEEQDIAESKLTGRGWMGASDAGVEREWRWVVGPEGCPSDYDFSVDGFDRTACPMGELKPTFDPCDNCGGLGTLFGIQRSDRPGLIPEPGMYNNFKSSEPNEYRKPCPGLCDTAGEDYAHFYADGVWNDYPLEHSIEGYMCEWGGLGEACMPHTHISQAVVLHDKCPPSAPVTASIIKSSGFTEAMDGSDVTVGMPAWTNAILTKLPKYLTEVNGQVVQAFTADTLETGSAVRVKCPYSCDDKPCDIYVTHYLCPPCKNQNGGLPSSLLSDGWQAGSCAPKFMENNDGVEHSMVAFRRRIQSGEEIDLPFLTSDLSRFEIFGISQIDSCQNANNGNECGSISGCNWKNGACAEEWCPRNAGPQNGNGNSCTVCASTDGFSGPTM